MGDVAGNNVAAWWDAMDIQKLMSVATYWGDIDSAEAKVQKDSKGWGLSNYSGGGLMGLGGRTKTEVDAIRAVTMNLFLHLALEKLKAENSRDLKQAVITVIYRSTKFEYAKNTENVTPKDKPRILLLRNYEMKVVKDSKDFADFIANMKGQNAADATLKDKRIILYFVDPHPDNKMKFDDSQREIAALESVGECIGSCLLRSSDFGNQVPLAQSDILQDIYIELRNPDALRVLRTKNTRVGNPNVSGSLHKDHIQWFHNLFNEKMNEKKKADQQNFDRIQLYITSVYMQHEYDLTDNPKIDYVQIARDMLVKQPELEIELKTIEKIRRDVDVMLQKRSEWDSVPDSRVALSHLGKVCVLKIDEMYTTHQVTELDTALSYCSNTNNTINDMTSAFDNWFLKDNTKYTDLMAQLQAPKPVYTTFELKTYYNGCLDVILELFRGWTAEGYKHEQNDRHFIQSIFDYYHNLAKVTVGSLHMERDARKKELDLIISKMTSDLDARLSKFTLNSEQELFKEDNVNEKRKCFDTSDDTANNKILDTYSTEALKMYEITVELKAFVSHWKPRTDDCHNHIKELVTRQDSQTSGTTHHPTPVPTNPGTTPSGTASAPVPHHGTAPAPSSGGGAPGGAHAPPPQRLAGAVAVVVAVLQSQRYILPSKIPARRICAGRTRM